MLIPKPDLVPELVSELVPDLAADLVPDEPPPVVIPLALGPGDADPQSPIVIVAGLDPDVAGAPALGPGDDDPRSPIVFVAAPPPVEGADLDPATLPDAPLAFGPGDLVGPEDDYVVLVPTAPGPGSRQSARTLVRFLRQREAAPQAAKE